ncbi:MULTISPECIES: hypothetical protein [Aeromonas]|uniref:hypothetical protein n=1 Tax=Aeromonas TaxID=642 RepID=UPI0007188F56|nr:MULTISPECIES: hypothetical protein [Aeromonas]HDN9000390.1 hypothetical protein [Aeromonas veronii AMC24]KRV88368.1 hypothetical protein AO718_14040 [Aeromonas veronii]KRW04232.1 hypothetical protein AO725_10510 [Aeromonas veronii]KRW12679.1 hypothetical protein AO745_12835 [Aeromonas veronii]KRW14550.1 hypothetical protein AO732_16215 [Aeromonas veronii]
MSLTQLAARLPCVALARLLLALLLVCNLTLCISWHGSPPASEPTPNSAQSMVMFDSSMAVADDDISHAMLAMDHSGDVMPLSCHQGDEGSAMGDECQMQTGVNALSFGAMALLGVLVALLIFPLLLGNNVAASLLDNWLRDPFLRSRGTHPPSWPRRHLMLSVLRH